MSNDQGSGVVGDVTSGNSVCASVTTRKPRREQKLISSSEHTQSQNGKEVISGVKADDLRLTASKESLSGRIKTRFGPSSEPSFFEESMAAAHQTPRRNVTVQEEESDESSTEFVIENTTLVSMDSKYTAQSYSNGITNDSTSMTSDSNTENSSVAHLRHWLDEFGQKHKKHYEQVSSIGFVPPETMKVTRMLVPKAKSDVLPSSVTPATAAALHRKLDSTIPRARSTPVRIKVTHSDVEATNEGYKSVAKLAAWLADDPTKPKKEVKTIRRGANVIAKSRTFDKGLANVIIEQHSIRTGSVFMERRRLEAEADQLDSNMEMKSSVSVSHKKEWLAGAFKKSDPADDRARTELVTEQEKRDDVSARAKQLWRERAACTSSKAKQMWRERPAGEKRFPPKSPIGQRLIDGHMVSPSHTEAVVRSRSPALRLNAHCTEPISREKENKMERESTGELNDVQGKPEDEAESEKEVGFSEARKLLVQRSKKNGHDAYVLSKVGLKKAKFERIERENRMRNASHGHVKSQWAGPSPTEGRPSNAYVRSYVANPATKKSIHELP
ncbi:hypothetical protein ACA910_017265 [Epithemia clementina (nom. ined.)]